MKALSDGGQVSVVPNLLLSVLPAFFVLAPDYIPLLLRPVLDMTLSWPMNYALHDIGKHFPNATGPIVDEESSPLQQTSALLILAYAYQKVSGKFDFGKPLLQTLQRYADYLVQYGQHPPAERSVFDLSESRSNQTLLVMSSAIGLKAFGALSGMSNYSDVGDAYASIALSLGTDSKRTHFVSHLGGADSSWSTAWPLAYDKLLGLKTFNSSVHRMQSSWYESNMQRHGLPFSSNANCTVAEIGMMAAATSSQSVRALIVDSVYNTTTSEMEAVPGPNAWPVFGKEAGKRSLTKAQAAVGGYWMIAAVNMFAEDEAGAKAFEDRDHKSGVQQVPFRLE